jgi:adenylate kinase family enzyme
VVQALAAHPEGWVVDGNYSRIRDVALATADTVVWLRLPWRVSFWRLLQRTVSRARSREPLYEGSPARESWRLSFLSGDSILWWSISHHRAHVRDARRRIAELPDSIRVYELRSGRDVEAFLNGASRLEKV